VCKFIQNIPHHLTSSLRIFCFCSAVYHFFFKGIQKLSAFFPRAFLIFFKSYDYVFLGHVFIVPQMPACVLTSKNLAKENFTSSPEWRYQGGKALLLVCFLQSRQAQEHRCCMYRPPRCEHHDRTD